MLVERQPSCSPVTPLSAAFTPNSCLSAFSTVFTFATRVYPPAISTPTLFFSTQTPNWTARFRRQFCAVFCRLSPGHESPVMLFAASYPSLCSVRSPRSLCFQWLTASFCRPPGVPPLFSTGQSQIGALCAGPRVSTHRRCALLGTGHSVPQPRSCGGHLMYRDEAKSMRNHKHKPQPIRTNACTLVQPMPKSLPLNLR